MTDSGKWEEREIPLPMALGAALLVTALMLAMGIYMGDRFFWNPFDHRSEAQVAAQRWLLATHREPANPEAFYQLGWAYYQLNDPGKARQAYDRVLELQPDHVGARYNLALIDRDQGHPEQAEPLLKWITDRYPRHELAEYTLGLTYVDLKRFDEAAAALQRALAVNPASADTHLQLGLCYRALGDDIRANNELREALRYNPNLEQAKQALAER